MLGHFAPETDVYNFIQLTTFDIPECFASYVGIHILLPKSLGY